MKQDFYWRGHPFTNSKLYLKLELVGVLILLLSVSCKVIGGQSKTNQCAYSDKNLSPEVLTNLLRSGEDLCNADLRKIKLHLKNFDSPKLRSVNFSSSNILNVRFLNASLDNAKFISANLTGVDFSGSSMKGADLKNTNLLTANFDYADVTDGNFDDSRLTYANLNKADFEDTSFKWSRLDGAKLKESNLKRANFQHSIARAAKFQGANLSQAKLQRADLSGSNFGCSDSGKCVDVSNAVFYGPLCTHKEKECDWGENYAANFGGSKNIYQMVYDYSDHTNLPVGVYEIQSQLRQTGHYREASEFTYFLKHGELMEIETQNPDILSEKWIELWSKRIGFEWTVEWGRRPNKAILELLPQLIAGFGFSYFILLTLTFLTKRHKLGSLFIVKEAPSTSQSGGHSFLIKEGEFIKTNVLTTIIKSNKLYSDRLKRSLAISFSKSATLLLLHSIWFSILSAFHFGWRDLNIGNWISRIQPVAFSYRPTGIIKTISGLQSLVCIYLVAIWALTTFGSPWG